MEVPQRNFVSLYSMDFSLSLDPTIVSERGSRLVAYILLIVCST